MFAFAYRFWRAVPWRDSSLAEPEPFANVIAMTMRQYYDWQTAGGAGDVMLLVETLEHLEIPWCMIGGLAVNHWAEEAMATAVVDIVIATERVDEAVAAPVAAGFVAQRHAWSINLAGRSNLSVQIRTENFYQTFPSRSVPADVNGILMRVAACEDTLAGKVLAYSDKDRRPSKRQKDLADIARLLEPHPQLRERVPAEVLERLV